MKKIFGLFIISALLLSCSKDSENNPEKFRSIYENTVWVSGGFNWITFNPDKIFTEYFKEAGLAECNFWKIGTYNNVSFDGCTYDTVEYVLILEDKDTFVISQTTSSGTNNSNGNPCGNGQIVDTLTFQVVNDSEISMSVESDNGNKYGYSFIKTTQAFPGNECVDVNLTNNGYLW